MFLSTPTSLQGSLVICIQLRNIMPNTIPILYYIILYSCCNSHETGGILVCRSCLSFRNIKLTRQFWLVFCIACIFFTIVRLFGFFFGSFNHMQVDLRLKITHSVYSNLFLVCFVIESYVKRFTSSNYTLSIF